MAAWASTLKIDFISLPLRSPKSQNPQINFNHLARPFYRSVHDDSAGSGGESLAALSARDADRARNFLQRSASANEFSLFSSLIKQPCWNTTSMKYTLRHYEC